MNIGYFNWSTITAYSFSQTGIRFANIIRLVKKAASFASCCAFMPTAHAMCNNESDLYSFMVLSVFYSRQLDGQLQITEVTYNNDSDLLCENCISTSSDKHSNVSVWERKTTSGDIFKGQVLQTIINFNHSLKE